MSVVLFCQLVMCAANIAFFLFVVESTKLFSLKMLVALIGMFSILLPTFFYCLLSERVTHALDLVGDAFYECSWYRLRLDQQRLFLMPILRAQRSFQIMGLGIVGCSLGAFLSVNFLFSLEWRFSFMVSRGGCFCYSSRPCCFMWHFIVIDAVSYSSFERARFCPD